jgi:hypothetical protein
LKITNASSPDIRDKLTTLAVIAGISKKKELEDYLVKMLSIN